MGLLADLKPPIYMSNSTSTLSSNLEEFTKKPPPAKNVSQSPCRIKCHKWVTEQWVTELFS